MKRRYIKPTIIVVRVTVHSQLMNASQVTTGGIPSDEYDPEDVTYSRGDTYNVWGE